MNVELTPVVKNKRKTKSQVAANSETCVDLPSVCTKTCSISVLERTLDQVFEKHEDQVIEQEAVKKQRKAAPNLQEIANTFESNQEILAKVIKSKVLAPEETRVLSTINSQIKYLTKIATKNLNKQRNETPRKMGQSGIIKPVQVTPEMSEFADWPLNEKHSRVEIASTIFKYIKKNNLQNPERKVQIIPDAELTKLLNYKEEEDGPLIYTTIQRLIGRLIVN